jgi:ATP-dependent DNA ligase
MEFPKLILDIKSRRKSSSNNSKKVWQIKTKIDPELNKITLITESGELGGHLKSNQKILSNIKLSSKKGITSLEKYAEEQAKKLFNNKKREGYIEYNNNNNNNNENEINNAETPKKIEEENENSINKKITIRTYYPMLAHRYNEKKGDIKFPCFVQPKLDGVRCVVVGNKLYSRNGNRFPVLPHIENELKLYNKNNLILDGELFTDDINFEKIVGLVKKI